uniref:hypothetical protein n=1 Tax=Streptomyces sp. YIM 98790 TaxID=2689077 RepID=UPI00140AAEAC
MRGRARAVLVALLGLSALLLTAAPPAAAGGPTSVLLNDGHRATAFPAHSTEYADLERLLEAPVADPETGDGGEDVMTLAGKELPPELADYATGGACCAIRVTWLAHDVNAWRQHLLYVLDDSVWVNRVLHGEETLSSWYRAPEEEELLWLLETVGMVGEGTSKAVGLAAARFEATGRSGLEGTAGAGTAASAGAGGLAASWPWLAVGAAG